MPNSCWTHTTSMSDWSMNSAAAAVIAELAGLHLEHDIGPVVVARAGVGEGGQDGRGRGVETDQPSPHGIPNRPGVPPEVEEELTDHGAAVEAFASKELGLLRQGYRLVRLVALPMAPPGARGHEEEADRAS